MREPHVIVLGGGFAGLAACRELKGKTYRVTLIDRQNHHLFQPLLYQVATAGLSATEIAQPLRSVLADQPNATTLMAEVRSIDLAAQTVSVADAEGGVKTLSYDYLIIGLGARTSYFGREAWAQHTVGLKSLNEALDIRQRVLQAFEAAESSDKPEAAAHRLNFVVVGGGPTGVEVAGALAELAKVTLEQDFRHIRPEAARIHLIEAGPRLLSTFDESLSAYTAGKLSAMGVTIHTQSPVIDIQPGRVHLNGLQLDASLIIWAAGVEGVPLTRTLGVPVDPAGRILVEPDLSLPGHPNVFAIGDLVHLIDKNGVRVPSVAPAASQMGVHAARIIQGEALHRRVREKHGATVPRSAFAYWDKGSMATIGRSAAVAQAMGIKVRGFIAWLMWLFIHLLFLVGGRNRVFVFFQWLWAYVTWQKGARIIIGTTPHREEKSH